MTGSKKDGILDESAEMLEEIRKTGNDIAESLTLIRERLSGEHLKNRALYRVVTFTAVRVERAAYVLRKYPVPALAAAALLCWLSLRKGQSR